MSSETSFTAIPAVGKKYRFREHIHTKGASLTTVKVFEVVTLGDQKISVGYRKHGFKYWLYVEDFWLHAEEQV